MAKETLGYTRLVWICTSCGTKNPGPYKFCSSCGSPQPAEVKFVQAEDEALLTDAAEIQKAAAGADIYCGFCGTRNPAGTRVCAQCGADLVKGAPRASGEVLGAHHTGPAAQVACPACGTPNPADAAKCVKCGSPLGLQPAQNPAAPAKMGKGLMIALIIGAVALCLLAIFGISMLTRTKASTGVIQSVAWNRSIAVEEIGDAQHDAWRDEVPAEAVLGTCSQKYRNSQDSPAPVATKVCGTPYTVDKGNGYGEVQQDCEYEVYDDWCSYTVKEWQVVDTLQKQGSDLSPVWPALQLAQGQREGQRAEEYKVLFEVGGKQYTYTTQDAAEYARFQPGSQWKLNINGFGAVVSVEPAQ